MKNQFSLFAAIPLVLISPLHAVESLPQSKPNIIFILADDLGLGNVGCYGADLYRTPQIDHLAASGIRFTRCFTAPLCGPSRALILTGRYAFRTGATNQDSTGRMTPDSEAMMPSYLRTVGYLSSCIGKWGQLPLTPREFGFDDEFRFRGSGVYSNSADRRVKYWVNGNERQLRDGQYLPDLMHSHLVDFISQHRDKPFYVYYSLSHVHGELAPTPDSGSHPADLMADNVAYMDKLVGKVVTELDRLKLRDRTLLVFMGDNGTGSKWADRSTIGGRRLSGKKGEMLEGGSLVPCIASWPGVIAPGQVCHDLIDSTDFVPTFATLAGMQLPSNKVLDGHSIAARLRGGPYTPRDHVFVQLARDWYVRDSDWKLNHKSELFDMTTAPFAEKLIDESEDTKTSRAARTRLAAALSKLNPAGGILDDGDGSGRHAGKSNTKSGDE